MSTKQGGEISRPPWNGSRALCSSRRFRAVTLFAALSLVGAGLPLEGPWAETFLRQGKVVGREALKTGVTRSQRVTLETDELTARAIWKTFDERKPIKRFADGTWEAFFVDSYKNEIAGYELDKLIGLGLVPPTVERRMRSRRGSLQLWVEGVVTETERLELGLPAQDTESWNRQMLKVRLFHNLTYNTDFNNAGNILSDTDGRIYLIDHSRAFRTHGRLLAEADLTRFSRSLLDGLRRLDRETLRKKLGRWLSKDQIEGLLARRDLILDLAERRIVELGEARALYP